MPVNADKSAELLNLAKSFTSSYEQRDRLSAALREHLGVTPRDSFWLSDDGVDDVLGPVVIYRFERDAFAGEGGAVKASLPSNGADSFFRATFARTADGYTFGEPVKVIRRTDYVRDSGADEAADAGADETEVPEWLARALAMVATLTKGAGHRYIRRVPRSGGGYRYFYKVSGGGGLGHEEEMKVGAKFRVTNGGKDGHFEVVGKDASGNLRIKHDESGHESTVSPGALKAMLHAEHAQSLNAHKAKLAADIKDAADPKAKARLLAEAGKYEHTRDLAAVGAGDELHAKMTESAANEAVKMYAKMGIKAVATPPADGNPRGWKVHEHTRDLADANGVAAPIDRKQHVMDSFRRQGEDHTRISQSGPDDTQRALYAESGRLHLHAANLMAQHKEGQGWPDHVQDAMTAAKKAHEKAYKHVPAAKQPEPAKAAPEPEKPGAKVLASPTKSGGGSFHERAAAALGWSVKDTQSMSLQSLRDNLRPVAPELASEASQQIAGGKVVHGSPLAPPLSAKDGMSWLGDPNDWKPGLRPGDEPAATAEKKPVPPKERGFTGEKYDPKKGTADVAHSASPGGDHHREMAKKFADVPAAAELHLAAAKAHDAAHAAAKSGSADAKKLGDAASGAGFMAKLAEPVVTPGDHTKLYNWGSTHEHPTARATGTAARTMSVGDRDYQLVPQPRPGKPPGFVANASMPGRAGSLDAKGGMSATPHVFDTATDAHAAVVKYEAERDRLAAKGRSNREQLNLGLRVGGTLPPPQGAKPDPRDNWNRDHGHLADRIVAGNMAPGENGGVLARYKTHEVGGKTVPVSGEIHGQYGVHQSDMGDDRLGKSPKYKVTHLPTGKGLGPEMSEGDAHKLAQTFDSKHKHAGKDVPVGGSIDDGEFKKMSSTFKKFMQARQNDRDAPTKKSMSTVTDPERDLAKSLQASHMAAAEAQPDAGAAAAHREAAGLYEGAARTLDTPAFRAEMASAGRVAWLVKSWLGIPDQQRPAFAAFRKSMESPVAARPFAFTGSNGTGDALGNLPAVVAGSRPAAEVTTPASPEPTTYSAERGAVNGMRKSMGAFYGRIAAGAAQQAVVGVRCPPEAPMAKSGGPFIGPHGGKWADAAHTIPWKEPSQHIEAGMSPANPERVAHHEAEAARHREMAEWWKAAWEKLDNVDHRDDADYSRKLHARAAGAHQRAADKHRDIAPSGHQVETSIGARGDGENADENTAFQAKRLRLSPPAPAGGR